MEEILEDITIIIIPVVFKTSCRGQMEADSGFLRLIIHTAWWQVWCYVWVVRCVWCTCCVNYVAENLNHLTETEETAPRFDRTWFLESSSNASCVVLLQENNQGQGGVMSYWYHQWVDEFSITVAHKLGYCFYLQQFITRLNIIHILHRNNKIMMMIRRRREGSLKEMHSHLK